eukprot:11788710-Alexandrium_andersonii.AAC.1
MACQDIGPPVPQDPHLAGRGGWLAGAREGLGQGPSRTTWIPPCGSTAMTAWASRSPSPEAC